MLLVVCTALSKTTWITHTEKCMHAGYQSTWMVMKLVIWDSHAFDTLYPSRRAVAAVQSYSARSESIMLYMKPKKASMMWKHPSPLREFQTISISKEDNDDGLLGT